VTTAAPFSFVTPPARAAPARYGALGLDRQAAEGRAPHPIDTRARWPNAAPGSHEGQRRERSMSGGRASVARYAVAVGAVVVAVALEAMRSDLDGTRRLVLLNGAVLVAAWYGGRGPALSAIALATMAAACFLVPPHGSLPLALGAATALGMFVAEMSVCAGLMIAVTESRSSARRREEQLRKLNKAHRALTVATEALVRAEDDAVLLEEICRAIVEVADYRMCWVGLAEHDDARTVRPIARAGHDEGYVDLAEITWADTARGRGPVGTAIRTGRADVRPDIAADPVFCPWRAEALKRGYASMIATPLSEAGQVVGVLAIYAAERDAFDADAVQLLTGLGDDLAYGISALRARAWIAAGRARLEAALMAAPVAVVVFAGPDHVVRLANRR
jgi:putative methionine-R-sulfoxide reductase with GAF domain